MNKIKKIQRDNAGIPDEKILLAVKEEMGDVLWYLAQLSNWI